MQFNFDINNLYEAPVLKICKPDKTSISFLQVSELKISPTLCDTSPLTFKIYVDNPNYQYCKKYMVIYADGFGYFGITNVSVYNDGVSDYKEVEAQSYEIVLNNVLVTLEDTTYKLYDTLNPSSSLLGILASYTNWTIGHVDDTLLNKYRTFEINNISIYNFLMTDISVAYNCYFSFDTINQTINCYDKNRTVVTSDIWLSFDNLLNSIDISDNSNDVCTALTVTGADGVGISNVNPLGGNVIYDFSYFKDSSFGMSAGLIEAVNAWETAITEATTNYSTYTTQRATYAGQLVTLNSELRVLQTELATIEISISEAISKGEINRLPDLSIALAAKEVAITSKKAEIDAAQINYNAAVTNINTIVDSLSFANNFTSDQRNELFFYVKTGSYTNENFVYTSILTENQKNEIATELYLQGKDMLSKVSQPLYQFDIKVGNFLFMQEYQPFINEFALGQQVNAEISSGTWVKPKVLRVELDYDNPKSTNIIFSDSYRILNQAHIFADGFSETTKSSNKVSMSASLWDEPIKNGTISSMSAYMNNALDLARQEIVNSENQEFTMGEYGLIGKKKNTTTGVFEPEQIRMNNNLLCFTDDGWASVKEAIGKVTVGEQEMFGVVAGAIMGNLIAGEQLVLSNENNTFVVDGSGATLTNADLTVTNTTTKILLSPTNGIKIQKYNSTNNTWEDKFYTDNEGNITAVNITLESSSVGGWTTTANSLTAPTGDYIGSNGHGKLSSITWTPSSVTVDGTIFADNLKNSNNGNPVNVFTTVGSNVVMNGGWLEDNSVGTGKLKTLEVEELFADYLVAGTAIFSGTCSWTNTGGISGATISPNTTVIVDTSVATGLDFNAGGNININSGYGNINLTAQGFGGDGWVNANNLQVTEKFWVNNASCNISTYGENIYLTANDDTGQVPVVPQYVTVNRLNITDYLMVDGGYPSYPESFSITLEDTNGDTHTMTWVGGILYEVDGVKRF